MTRQWCVICCVVVVTSSGCGDDPGDPASTSADAPIVRPGLPPLREGEQPLAALSAGVSRVSPELYATIFADIASRSRVVLPRVSEESGRTSKFAENPGYVGPQACDVCHAEHYKSCLETAHFQTSELTDSNSTHALAGDVPPRVSSGDESLWYRIERTDGQLFQTVVVENEGTNFVASFPVSVVTGSGRHGQTFLTWDRDALFELPVSYVTSHDAFMHSPGFQPGVANMARPIGPRCLECHTTWFARETASFNRYSVEDAITGVTCEVCHGPGQEHVAFHQQHPDEAEPRHITNPHDLPRERLIDLCSLCHGGSGTRLQAEFSFRPGDELSAHLALADDAAEHGPQGVHAANQAARLARSQCFQQTLMSCTDCHDLHTPEGPPTSFTRNCLTCHETAQCLEVVRLGDTFSDKCVECHMPLRGDDQTRFHNDSGEFVPALRDHFIAVWPDVAKEIARPQRQTSPNP